ncbi:COP23 domain-containing protein [Nodularia harveyana UHCC-0300]|uniref:COP23 domain-containing protein n=1 Tax=Nodularia harveyana UHCC-0300 TaxID=2974287 RepID=A0ABU5UGS6_9CYAN|nr:COP23 domain-containing protein [Nodularia harveyana]MEA5582758.1 COP23 domain-containing protein [Nodularia harveyana UHCC-0300]
MKLQSLKKVVIAGSMPAVGIAIALGTTFSLHQPSYAQAQGFYCDRSTGVPVTVYQNSQGISEPWIKWTSNYFRSSGYNSVARCQEVSGRLETYRRNKQLKLITVGRMNGQNVVCTASQVNGRCEGLIFTLKPGQDAVKTLTNFLAWREGQAGLTSLSESGAAPYIDVSGRLGEDVGSTMTQPTTPTPTNVQPTPSQPNSERSREFN